MPETLKPQLHVFVTGLVQGVGYRHGTYLRANALQLSGWVKNLPDGRVEAVFEGPRDILQEMLAWCHQGPPLSNVRAVDETWKEAAGRFGSFEIRF